MEKKKYSQPDRKQGVELFISERNKKLRDLFTEIGRKIPEDKVSDWRNMIFSHLNLLIDKYPDHNGREVFHILNSSGIPASHSVTEEDFPEPDSVETFLNNLKIRYNL